jgi:hypothetical protein
VDAMKRRSRAGGEPIKGRRGKTPEPKRRNVPKIVTRSNSSSAGDETEVARLTRELNEALEQQTATSEVLQVVSSFPGDLQPVFDKMLEKAAGICDAKFGNIYRWDGELLHLAATHKTPPAFADARRRTPLRPNPKLPLGRVIATKALVHVTDAAAEEAYTELRHPAFVAVVELWGCTDVSVCTDAQAERTNRCVHVIPPRSPALHRQTDRAGHELCRSSRHCNRERASTH